jgi:hypothetical protein
MEHGSKPTLARRRSVKKSLPRNAWPEKSLQDNERRLDTIMAFFCDYPTVELILPVDSSSNWPYHTDGWKAEGSDKVRAVLEWCWSNSLTLEQSRDYEVHEDGQNRTAVSCWALATADHFGDPIKGRVEVILNEGKVEHFTLYPLSSKVMHKLKEDCLIGLGLLSARSFIIEVLQRIFKYRGKYCCREWWLSAPTSL